MTQRTIEAIRTDMHLRKEDFDARYITGDFAMNYSRAAIQHQWGLFQAELATLMKELARAEATQTAAEKEAAAKIKDDFSVSVVRKESAA